MSKRIPFLIGFLIAAWLIPVQAEELQLLTFGIGGGITAPLNPTAKYVGLSGNFVTGAGVNINKNNSIEGEFMWSGLPPSLSILHPINAPTGSINLYTLNGDYRFHLDSLGGSVFGVYLIGGGGWYYRYATVSKNYVVPPNTVCQPIYTWWGYGCDTSGFVYSATVAYKGTSAPGLNAGFGFTIRLGDKGWKFYTESRYTYAWNNRIPTTLIPVTFGLRYN